ncbi:MAG TPA: hypothetical protein VIO61_04145 [Anaerolineaceae bacterium]
MDTTIEKKSEPEFHDENEQQTGQRDNAPASPLPVFPPDSTPKRKINRVARILIGVALLLPAAAGCLVSYLIPSIQTFSLSLTNSNLISPPAWVGFANYTRMFSDALFGSSLRFTGMLLFERVLVVAVVPVLMALAVNEFRRWIRVALRIIFSIPLALHAPVWALLVWVWVFNPIYGSFAAQAARLGVRSPNLLADPAQAPLVLLVIDACMTAAMATGLSLLIFRLAVPDSATSKPSFGKVARVLAAPWLVMILAAAASSIQAFLPSYLITNGGPASSTVTLAFYQYTQSFLYMKGGYSAAVAVLGLILLALPGVLAAALLAVTGVRFESVASGKTGRLMPAWLGIVLVVLLGLLSLILLLPNWNTLSFALTSGTKTSAQMMQVPPAPAGTLSDLMANFQKFSQSARLPTSLVNMLLPALFSLLIQFGFTYPAALGLGGLRPLGKHSEWLLLLFAPWLFTGYLSFATVFLQSARNLSLINSLGAMVTPFWVNIPLLFALALFFKGRAPVWERAVSEGSGAARAFFVKMVLPSLPFAALLGLFQFFTSIQELLQPLVVVNKLDMMPLQQVVLAVRNVLMQTPTVWLAGLGMVWLVQAAIGLLAIILFQVFYVDRVALGPLGEE